MKLCEWCRVVVIHDRGQRFCGRKCRQAAFRLRKLSGGKETSLGPGTPAGQAFCYADPPYPGTAKKYYGDQPTYAGEVDHQKLIEQLMAGGYAGWALSTSAKALRTLLPLCPEGTLVCPWVKPIGVPAATFGAHNTWEPLLVYGGRKCRPGVRDWLAAQPARLWGDLPGRKPLAFCAWMFDLLGMVPGDQFVELFPGTAMATKCWSELSAKMSDQLELSLELSATGAEPNVRRSIQNLLTALDVAEDVVADPGDTPAGATAP